MNLERMQCVLEILGRAGVDFERSFFDFQHDIIYLPWELEHGKTAEELNTAGCHWDSEASSWASF